MVKFTHLHTHTPEGSLLDGFMRIDKAIEKAKRVGMDSIGVSEHGTMSSHKIFNDKMKAAGLHPVFGMEAYQTVDKSFRKEHFEGVDYVEGDNGHLVFGLFKEDEVHEDEWTLVSEIRPIKEMKEVELASKIEGAFMYKEVEETLPSGDEMPKGKAAITRRVNALLKEYEKKEMFLYVKADTTNKRYFEWFPQIGHLLLIAKNNEGYQNLLTLNAIGFKDGFYGKPRIDYTDLKKYGKGIVASSACLGGFIPQLILRGRLEEAKAEIIKTAAYFDEFFLEIQPSHQEDQHLVNEQLIKFSEELSIPLLATSDVHMVDKDELELHEQITNIGMGGAADTSDLDSDISYYGSAYMMEPQEILDHGIPRIALQNAYDLSHRCQVDFLDDEELKFPEYEIPEGYTFDSYLREKVNKGLFELFLEKDYIKDYNEYHERIDYELDVIKQKGYSAYFLIVEDYMNWAREAGIMVGPGRGSASGSLVSYVLKIINVDPIRHGLLFARFLNPERPSAPDIDSDFDYLRIGEVVDYMRERYGRNHVAKIGTYTTMTSRMALKDAGRVLGFDHSYMNFLTANIPASGGNVMRIEDAVENVKELKNAYTKNPELFDLGIDLQGIPRSKSIHAAGVIITPKELDRVLPLDVAKGEVVTQYDGETLEDLGYFKFDILAIKYLSVIRIALDLIKERHGVEIDIHGLELDDENVYRMIQDGNTMGLFQLAGEGMTEVFTGLNKVDFETLSAGIALYRYGKPGRY